MTATIPLTVPRFPAARAAAVRQPVQNGQPAQAESPWIIEQGVSHMLGARRCTAPALLLRQLVSTSIKRVRWVVAPEPCLRRGIIWATFVGISDTTSTITVTATSTYDVIGESRQWVQGYDLQYVELLVQLGNGAPADVSAAGSWQEITFAYSADVTDLARLLSLGAIVLPMTRPWGTGTI